MNLKKLFGSGARVKLLQHFLLLPDGEFYIRELTRILDEQINSLRRELENLETLGVLKSKEKNRRKFYRVNKNFFLLQELTSVMRKTQKSNKTLLRKIQELGSIDVLVLSGKFINKPKPLDMFLVGDIEKSAVESFLQSEFGEVPLTYNVMSKEAFLSRLALNDRFVQEIFEESENIILKNKCRKSIEEAFAV